jgi:hypothetical protein
MRIECPHCGETAVIRSSQRMAATVREARVQCQNVECAHTWIVHISAVRTLAPSMTPDPTVHIPLSPRSVTRKTTPQGELDIGEYRPRAMDSG